MAVMEIINYSRYTVDHGQLRSSQAKLEYLYFRVYFVCGHEILWQVKLKPCTNHDRFPAPEMSWKEKFDETLF